jgi:hypothetical protein
MARFLWTVVQALLVAAVLFVLPWFLAMSLVLYGWPWDWF